MEELLKSETYKNLDDETKILYCTYYCSSSVGQFGAYAGDYRRASFRSDKWTNLDSTPHKIKSDDFKDSSLLYKNDTYQIKFSKDKVYNYICAVHPETVGQIIVLEGKEAETAGEEERSEREGKARQEPQSSDTRLM